MFIGHYGAAVYDTQRGSGVPLITLWQGFLAVQAMDICWAILTIFGIEGAGEMVDGQPLFSIDWSHSLVTSILLALICGALFRWLKPSAGMKGFWIIAGLVFSHWVLDLIVHRPDLALYPGSDLMFGFGLWNAPFLAFILEMGLMAAGFLFWQKVTKPKHPKFTIAIWALFGFMAMLQVYFILLPGLAVQSGTFEMSHGLQGPALGFSSLTVFIIFPLFISWIEKGRPSKFSPELHQG